MAKKKLIATQEELDRMRKYYKRIGYGELQDFTPQAQQRMIKIMRADPNFGEK